MATEEQQSSQSESQEFSEQDMNEQKEELRKTLEETRRRVDETFAELRARTGDAQSVQQWIRDNPLVSTLAAAGAGLLIGKALSSLRSERVSASAPLAERIEARAREIARQREKEGRRTPEDRVREARDRARAAAEEARDESVRRFEETKQAVAQRLSDAVSKAALAFLAKKASTWVKEQKRRT